jgi:hypothetical protein
MFWPLADFAKDFRLRNWWLASEIHVTNNPMVVELHALRAKKEDQRKHVQLYTSPLPIAKIISVKNAWAWVSMVSYLRK